MTAADTYKAARAGGASVKTATYAAIDAHRSESLSGSDIMDLCVLAETGKEPLPKSHWEDDDGTPLQAAIDFHHAVDAHHDED